MSASKTPKVRMLITHHEGAELPVSITSYRNLFTPVIMPSNKYYESHLFRLPQDSLVIGDEDYVGHVTYSYKKKMSPIDFETVVAKYSTQNYDLFALFPAPNIDLYAHADTWHHGFLEIWDRLIHLLGYGSYRNYPTPPAFFCNYWIMKRDVFVKYKDIAKRAMDLIDTDPVLRDLCDRDSSYKGTHMRLDTERLIKIAGKPYYTFHPFVMERLICFVAQADNMRVKFVNLHDEKRNDYNTVSDQQPLYAFML